MAELIDTADEAMATAVFAHANSVTEHFYGNKLEGFVLDGGGGLLYLGVFSYKLGFFIRGGGGLTEILRILINS